MMVLDITVHPSRGGIEMSTGQAPTTQLKLEYMPSSKHMTVFSPPGICVKSGKYPRLEAGFLASIEPLEHLSIYDFPEAWNGLDRDTIFSMRRHLYQFLLPVDARSMQPEGVVHTLQEIALSVRPIALQVEGEPLLPRRLQLRNGQLPSSSDVSVKSVEILSEPEISKVAERITEQDIPAAEGIWRLIDYDYSLDQVVRLMSVGLLGRQNTRRMLPTRSAYKATINAFIDRAVMELIERPRISSYEIYLGTLFGDRFVVFLNPGEARVDYLAMDVSGTKITRGFAFEGLRQWPTDAKTSVYSDHARFSVYKHLISRNQQCHAAIFHLTKEPRNQILGPWIARAGVNEAFTSEPVTLDNIENAIKLLDTLLDPNFSVWTQDTPLLERLSATTPILSSKIK
jgi:hypothetical protein